MDYIEQQSQCRPRERLERAGPRALSDVDLLALMLGTGTRGCSVENLAAKVLPILDAHGGADLDALLKVSGIGRSKAYLLAAALEFARRRIHPEGIKIRRASDITPLLAHLVHRPQEHVVCVSLSGAHEVIKMRTVSIGLLTSCPIHPREVFVGPITDHAYSVIIAHNHPSGDPTPSDEDRNVTKQIAQAAKTLGIRLLDHIIIARRGYYSFQEMGLLSVS